MEIYEKVFSMATADSSIKSFTNANGEKVNMWIIDKGNSTQGTSTKFYKALVEAAHTGKVVPVDLRSSNSTNIIRPGVVYMVDTTGVLHDLIAADNRAEAYDLINAGENTKAIYDFLRAEEANKSAYANGNGKSRRAVSFIFVMKDDDTMELDHTVEYAGKQNSSYYTVSHQLHEYLRYSATGVVKLKKLGK